MVACFMLTARRVEGALSRFDNSNRSQIDVTRMALFPEDKLTF
jgi:hypothetical protein